MLVRLFVSGTCAFVTSIVLTYLCRHLAPRVGAVAIPRSDRWHRQPIPLLGGVAMALSLVAVVPAAAHLTGVRLIFLGGAAAIFVIGLLDDFLNLDPRVKLIGQILVATVLAGLGLQLRLTPMPVLNFALTVFWIVGITNAFNLLDNMDGLAAGIAAITVGFRLVFFISDGDVEGAALAAVFLGTVLGFLVHNFAPAAIFMGDAGSLFVGFFVSGLSLVGTYPHSRGVLSVMLFPVLILLVPIFDTTFVTVNRILADRPVWVGGRDHTSHRLVAAGLSERRAVSWLYGIAVVSGVIAYLTRLAGLSYAIVLIVFLALGTMVLGVFLSRIRVYPAQTASREVTWVARLLGALSTKRQVTTTLVDLVLIVVAYYSACLLRFEENLALYRSTMMAALPIVIASQVVAFGVFRVPAGIWRYTGLKDLLRIVQAATAGTIGAVLVILFAYRFVGHSRAVFVLDWLLLIVFVSAARLSFRLLSETLQSDNHDSSRVLVYGAGAGGMVVLRELRHNRALGRSAIGFLDDDPVKHHRLIQGVPVLGGLEHLPAILLKYRVQEVVVASVNIPSERVRHAEDVCGKSGVRVARVALRMAGEAPGKREGNDDVVRSGLVG